MTAPFAALILERDPYTFADFPGLAQAWFQDAGGFFFVGLLVYLLISITRPQAVPTDGKRRSSLPLLCAAVATLLYAVYGLVMISGLPSGFQATGYDLLNVKPPPDPTGYVKTVTPRFSLGGYTYDEIPNYLKPYVRLPEGKTPQDPAPYPWQALLLTLGGAVSFVGASWPMASNLRKLRFRRIWAMAVLCVKEGLRNKLFLAFLVILVPLMFPINWFVHPKPEDDLREAVRWVSLLIAPPLVLLAVLLAAYALPNDVKNQNIYTIVTKPVERFEIVLGRFLGYAALLTGVVLVVGLFTLLTIEGSNASQASWDETGRARVPTRGKLSFQSRKAEFAGTDVGREFNYRKYIGGSPSSSQRAVYAFRSVPGSLARAEGVPVEFNFDIYRLTKGEENRGVQVNVRVVSWQRDQAPPAEGEPTGEWKWGKLRVEDGRPVFTPDPAEQNYKADALAELRKVPEFAGRLSGSDDTAQSVALQLLSSATPGSAAWPAANLLAKKYGYFEYRGKEVFDFHPERIEVPPGLFENATADAGDGKQYPAGSPRVTVYVHCTTNSQMLGMAEGDLYLLEAEQPFWWNHLKSMVGLWCWLVLAAGLGVCLSTYLDFIVTLLATLFLFVLAFFDQFINELGQTIGQGQNGQAGPFRALDQLLQAKQATALPEGTAVERTADVFDVGYAWAFRRVLNVLPDVHAFEWTRYVAEGFTIPETALVMNLVVLAAYLFPWFLLAYYLIRGREVAA